MSETNAIQLVNVGKMYKLFPSRMDNFLDAINLQKLIPWRKPVFKEFWALRNIDLELKQGHRIGILGRNGAGKSTLLKLITQNLAPTEGMLTVNGRIQALMDTGAGFHPEFTGYENVYASLTYLGLNKRQMDEALEDIVDFTELGDFMDQPFKTYSAGMQARLTFATATAIHPDILIIDEILGAGDAYFISKSTERMKKLIGSEASVLLVSHALDHITMICDQAVWLDRGRVVMQGESIEVVKAYQKFIRELENERLMAKNYKKLSGKYSTPQLDVAADCLMLNLSLTSPVGCECEVREVRLNRDNQTLERVLVGAPQDVSAQERGFVVLDGYTWSEPIETNGEYRRALATGGSTGQALGAVAFNLDVLDETRPHDIEVHYRCTTEGSLETSIMRNNEVKQRRKLPTGSSDWRIERFHLDPVKPAQPPQAGAAPEVHVNGRSISRWPSEGSLRISNLSLLDAQGQPHTIFEAGSTIQLVVEFECMRPGTYRFLPVAVIFRMDGINISTQIGEWAELEMNQGEQHTARLTIRDLNLGNGNYIVSVALYKTFHVDLQAPSDAFDLIDRSVEFRVVGQPAAISSVFIHPCDWSVQ